MRAPHHIDLEAFAAALDIQIVRYPLRGASAWLVRNPRTQRARIYLDDAREPAARRFSLAHELGHFILRHPSRRPDAVSATCLPYAASDGGPDERDHEAEANAFAAELLMPAALVRPACEVSPVDLSAPREIAATYQVSILASAIRFAELTSERCAAVLCVDGHVKWCVPSATFPVGLSRGRALKATSIAARYFAGHAIGDAAQSVPVRAWLDGGAQRARMIEHAVAAVELGSVLSMLWIPERLATALKLP